MEPRTGDLWSLADVHRAEDKHLPSRAALRSHMLPSWLISPGFRFVAVSVAELDRWGREGLGEGILPSDAVKLRDSLMGSYMSWHKHKRTGLSSRQTALD